MRLTIAMDLALVTVAADAATSIASPLSVMPTTNRVGRFERIEFRIAVDRVFDHPFNPAEADLSIEVQTPAGRTLRVPAFWHQPYERAAADREGRGADWLYPCGPAGWRARFAPMETGNHLCVARLRDSGGALTSAPVRFACVSSTNRGFVRVSRVDRRFFAFDDGTAFFPIGQNLAFIGAGQYANLSRAEAMLRRMAENGANYARVWACCDDWALAIESRKTAWGRSWGGKPPFVPFPDAGTSDRVRRCVQIGAGERGGASGALDPSHPVALRPDTVYRLAGRVRLPAGSSLAIERQGAAMGAPVEANPDGSWATFERDLMTDARDRWLGALRLRVNGSDTAYLDGLSLRERSGGPELLWEADPNRPVMGTYNPVDCFMLDEVVRAAEAAGVRLQLCLLTRNLYMDGLKDPAAPEYDLAIRNAQNLLRYAVARWGGSTAVATWEYWNEQDPGLPTARFYDEVGRYLEEVDPYRHLRATSAWGPAPKDWTHPRLDVADLHWYLRPNWNELWKDVAAAVADRAELLRRHAPDRPALLSEFGLADEKWGLSPYMREDKALLHFHDALWASAVSGLSGTTMSWWWDQLDRMDAYPHYRPLAGFLAGIPFPTARLRASDAAATGSRARVAGLQGTDCAYLWLSDPEAAWWAVVVGGASPAPVADARVDIRGLRPDDYRILWWDTYRGVPAREGRMSSPDGRLTVAAPPFTRDIALKITRE